jgi:hypothetical protein
MFPKDDPLIGTWNITKQITLHSNNSADTINRNDYFFNQYVFSDDKSLSCSGVILGLPYRGLSGTWSTNGDSITIGITSGQTTTWYHHISGNQLSMSRSEKENNGIRTITELYDKQ